MMCLFFILYFLGHIMYVQWEEIFIIKVILIFFSLSLLIFELSLHANFVWLNRRNTWCLHSTVHRFKELRVLLIFLKDLQNFAFSIIIYTLSYGCTLIKLLMKHFAISMFIVPSLEIIDIITDTSNINDTQLFR